MFNPMFSAWADLCDSMHMPWKLIPSDACSMQPAIPAGAELPLIRDRFGGASGCLDYRLFIPSGYCGEPCPLLVMLHGCGQDGGDFARGTAMNEVAEQFGCLVVYPEQSSGANGARCWNWFDEAHHHRGEGEPALIAGVTRKIMNEYAVDPEQVFVAGLSAGGAMAVVMARTYPDLFAAVGCHSGLAYACASGSYEALHAMRYGRSAGAEPDAGAALPVIVFHGDRDATVHPDNGGGVIEQSIKVGGSQRASRGAAMVSQLETGEAAGRAFSREIHLSVAGEVFAERWTVHGSGHAWSGGNASGSHADARGPDASSEMMRFFMDRRAANSPRQRDAAAAS